MGFNRSLVSNIAPTNRSTRWRRELAARVALVYLILSLIWILVSGRLAYLSVDSVMALATAETIKGAFFICSTSVLIYLLINYGLRKQEAIENALQGRQRQMSTLISNLPGVVYRCRNDEAWTIEFISDKVAEVTGYSARELMLNRATPFNHIIHPEDRAYVRQEVEAAIAEHRRFQIKYRIRHKSGAERWLQEQGLAVSGEEGEGVILEGFIEDITERHIADQRLRQSEERFRLLIEGARDCALFMLDPGGRVVTWNSGAERIKGYSADEILGRHLSCFYRPEDVAKGMPETVLEKARRTGVCDDEGWRIRKDGSQFWASTTLTSLWDEVGNLRGFSKVTRDRTLQYQQELRLQESEARLRAIYDESPAMYFTLSPGGEIESVNAYGAEHLGYGAEELRGRSIYQLIHPEDHPFARIMLAQIEENLGKTRRWEIRKLHKQGHIIWSRETTRTIRTVTGVIILVVCEDITEVHQLSEALEYQAAHDPLTELLNRRELERRLAHLIDSAWHDKSRHTLCYIDLDQFLLINDTCGHAGGDELLRQFGILLRDFVRRGDVLARMGGDEFAILIHNGTSEAAREIAADLKAAISSFRFVWADQSFHISASIGLVAIDENSPGVSEILRMADAACYAAKNEGRDTIRFYDESDSEQSRQHIEMQWANMINRALDDNVFYLVRQRIQSLNEKEPAGEYYELLLRMTSETGGDISPAMFMPAAERFGLAARVDRWVIHAAFSWLGGKPAELDRLNLCAINLSGQSLSDPDFLNYIIEQLNEYQIAAEKICFEITETAAISKYTHALAFINLLRERGCRFALDDFGSGLSSFGYLKHLPVDILKIDGLFVRNMNQDPMDYAMVKSINDLAHVMGKETVAEFVEDPALIGKLIELGVDYAQGFGIHRPVRLEAMG